MRRINIVQGEHAVVDAPNVVITTVLGSCIAVCLVDRARRIGGMNHFLLGQPASAAPLTDLQRYGIHAMELLVNALMRRGSQRGDLGAHLYGGATMISGLGDIGRRNIAFARDFLRTEGIAIRHEDVGGSRARRVEFQPVEGRSRCRLVREPVALAETTAMLEVTRDAGELELF